MTTADSSGWARVWRWWKRADSELSAVERLWRYLAPLVPSGALLAAWGLAREQWVWGLTIAGFMWSLSLIARGVLQERTITLDASPLRKGLGPGKLDEGPLRLLESAHREGEALLNRTHLYLGQDISWWQEVGRRPASEAEIDQWVDRVARTLLGTPYRSAFLETDRRPPGIRLISVHNGPGSGGGPENPVRAELQHRLLVLRKSIDAASATPGPGDSAKEDD